MDVYLLKSGACLAIFYMFYKLCLENESMHFFKRFYLIGILVLSFLIPLFTFTINVATAEGISTNIPVNVYGEESNGLLFSEVLRSSLQIIYIIGFLFFGIRFARNLIALRLRIQRNPKLKEGSHINVLLRKKVIPHTFLQYIFLNKVNFETNKIPEEVLLHEQTHARQRHSIDILFIEMLQIFFWFNPFIYLVKNSVKLNHEFLADQAVLSKGIHPTHYQEMLLLFSSKTTTPMLANSINYSLIKKRFTIMKTKTSNHKIWLRSALILPLLTILIVSFSTIEEVQENENSSLDVISQNELTKAQIKEYNKLAKHYNDLDQSKMRIKMSDVERLNYLYNLMPAHQQKVVEPFPNFPPPPPPVDTTKAPMRIKVGVNDTDPNAPPPPPKEPKPIKVTKGVNDTKDNIPPPPPKPTKDVKAPSSLKEDVQAVKN